MPNENIRHTPSFLQLATGLLAFAAPQADGRSPRSTSERLHVGRRYRERHAPPQVPQAPQTVPATPACASGATHPKVALMFLTRGALHNEKTWQAWLETAQGLQPKMPEGVAACHAGPASAHAASQPGMAAPQLDASAIEAQDLFNVYVHTPPANDLDPTSMFAPHVVQERFASGWGDHTLVDAERSLVRASLEDPRNARFVLLSESGVPLYPADTLYQQIMHEEKSRVNACFYDGSDAWRWHPAMGRDVPSVKMGEWRKSPQWFTLIRKHAEIFANDTAIDGVFRRHCDQRGHDPELQRSHYCYSDEHYLPVLLSKSQAGHETDCVGKSVSADWSRGGASPYTYAPEEVNASLLQRLRGDNCQSQEAIEAAPQMFTTQANSGLVSEDAQSVWNTSWLDARCPLFARKFGPNSAEAIGQLITDCDNGLQLSRC